MPALLFIMILALGTPVFASSVQSSPIDFSEESAGVGDVVEIEGWTISVTSVSDRRQWEGTITARVEVTNAGTAPGAVYSRFKFGIIGSDGLGASYDDECSKGATYEDDPYFSDVFPGATARMDLCWASEDTSLPRSGPVILYIHAFNRGSNDQAYFYFDLTKQRSAAPSATPPLMFNLVITVGDRYLEDLSTCETKGFYRGIRPGSEISITNAATDETLFTTKLSRGVSAQGSCSWTISVLRLVGIERYEVKIGEIHVGWLNYDEISDLDRIQITIGD